MHTQVLEFCKRLRIHYVTVYAFAIENFNRPKEEVDSLMELMREKLIEIAYVHFLLFFPFRLRNVIRPSKSEDLGKRGLRLNVLGRRELLPPAVQEAVEYAENLTRHNNVCVQFCSVFMQLVSMPNIIDSSSIYVHRIRHRTRLRPPSRVLSVKPSMLGISMAGKLPLSAFQRNGFAHSYYLTNF